MNILIKGMDMPPNCCQCPVNMDVCKRGYKYLLAHPELYDKRADDCPIASVPPHGRLIDADAFERQNVYFWNRDFVNSKCSETLADLVNAAPTIIEAEEEK